MGASNSTPNTPPRHALHVLRVAPGSPAADTDITPFFDFVVGVKGLESVQEVDAGSLERVVEAREGTEIELVVWSSKVQRMRSESHIVIFNKLSGINSCSRTSHTFTQMVLRSPPTTRRETFPPRVKHAPMQS